MFYIYIMTNRTRTVLYIGVTNGLERRSSQHVNSDRPSFTKRYAVNRIIYYELYSEVRSAIAREKEIKGWRREKKVALIESKKPPMGRPRGEDVRKATSLITSRPSWVIEAPVERSLAVFAARDDKRGSGGQSFRYSVIPKPRRR
jgi:putative endonuclease